MLRKAKKLYAVIALALAAMLLSATVAVAAVTFDPKTGEGFVGKGDVQLAFGWNNKQLQDSANTIQFRAITESATTWTCDRDAGPQTQERANTTTQQQVASSIARERNQITGFNLTGYSGTPTEIDRDGPPTGSCPTGWTAINQQTEEGSATLQVSNGGDWVNLT